MAPHAGEGLIPLLPTEGGPNANPKAAALHPDAIYRLNIDNDDVINYRLAFLTKNECPPTGLKPHTDVLKEFPYLGRRIRNSGAGTRK